jgi:ferric-dicitrate binding protein FerR (iron transport regulator)
VSHDDAWRRLPNLLVDRDDASLLAHVRACRDCQRQLFLLGRVDRLLRDDAAARRSTRRRSAGLRIVAATAAVAAAASALVLWLPQNQATHAFTLRTLSGRLVGKATMGSASAGNVSLALTAHDLPVDRGQIFVLWAADPRSSMQVGRFMVDRSGGCRVRFNLPAAHSWHRIWVTEPGREGIIAST